MVRACLFSILVVFDLSFGRPMDNAESPEFLPEIELSLVSVSLRHPFGINVIVWCGV